MAAGNDLIMLKHDGSNGYFTIFESLLRFLQRLQHVVLIGH